MRRPRKVALLIETSREYGRGLLRGVTHFHHFHPDGRNWSIYFEPHGLGDPPPCWLADWQGDGILARINDRRMADGVLATGLPVVDLGGTLGDLGIAEIGVDNRAVATMALRHLLDRGLRNFAYYGIPPGNNRWADERYELICRAVEEAGYNCHLFSSWKSCKNWDLGQSQLARWLEQLPKPVGVMTCHDQQGLRLLDACRRSNQQVPDQVAVLGIDNDCYICNLSIPPMSSVDVNPDRNGYEAALLLERMMRGRKPPESPIYFPPKNIITRQSTDVVAVDDPHVAVVVRYIRDHACDGITVEEALAQVPVSRSTVSRAFKRLLNRSPKSEITRVKLEKVKELLLETDKSITEIADLCGYNEAKYLIQVFHEIEGTTPLAFRRSTIK